MNARTLAFRDAALAATMGATPTSFGHDAVCNVSDVGNFYGDFGHMHGDFGADAEVAAAAATLPAAHPVNQALAKKRVQMAHGGGLPAGHPLMNMAGGATMHAMHPANNPANQGIVQQMWNQQASKAQATAERASELDPNGDSTVKIGRYGFAINQALVLNTPLTFTQTQNPDVNIRPKRVTMNAPAYGFVTITELKVSNVSVTVGGVQDAFDYNANAVDAQLDLPTMGPQTRATVTGNYTGFTPPGYSAAAAYTFTVSFRGPSNIAGSGGPIGL
jgi:hypothetical protein